MLRLLSLLLNVGPSSHRCRSARVRPQLTGGRKLRPLLLRGPSSSISSSGVTGGKTSTSSTAGRAQELARSSSNTASNDRPGIVRIEIRDRDAPRQVAKDQLLKPLAQTQSTSGGAASKPLKQPTKK